MTLNLGHSISGRDLNIHFKMNYGFSLNKSQIEPIANALLLEDFNFYLTEDSFFFILE